MIRKHFATWFLCWLLGSAANSVGFVLGPQKPWRGIPRHSARCALPQLVTKESASPTGSILLLDHLNINHRSGRHDLLKAFYFDLLGCSCDPRKIENLESGKKTLWANAGINQFHLPEAETAQVLDGSVILSYPDLETVVTRLSTTVPAVLRDTSFSWQQLADGSLDVTCPWGNKFILKVVPDGRDPRGSQPGERSEPSGMPAIVVHVAYDTDMQGIARFYRELFGAVIETEESDRISVACGPMQALVFQRQPQGKTVSHSDYHVSMYISPDHFQYLFRRMDTAGLVFVNPRFKRKASTLAEAVEQCMFRVRDIVDPAHPERGPILQLEHEIRSPIKADGSPYKSCPLRLQ